MRAAAETDDVGVAGYHIDRFDRDREHGANDLRETRLMPLAARPGADHDLDAALGGHRDLAAFARCPDRAFDIVGEAEPQQFAARLCRPPRAINPSQSAISIARSIWAS